jgi:hypothetical protein
MYVYILTQYTAFYVAVALLPANITLNLDIMLSLFTCTCSNGEMQGGMKIKLEYFNKKTMVRVRKVLISQLFSRKSLRI